MLTAFLLQATEPNNDGVWTDRELLWVVGVILVIVLILAIVSAASRGRDWW
jgi:hypothetical protein